MSGLRANSISGLSTADSIKAEAFRIFDQDGDGLITLSDLGAALRNLGQQPTQQELRQMMQEADVNGDGKIDYPEFLVLSARGNTSGGHTSEASLRHAFKIFDKDGNGFISTEELRQHLVELGQDLTLAEAAALLKEADDDGDGKLNFTEFTKLVEEIL